MITKIIRRRRIFIAGEGEGEQSFIKWIQGLSCQVGLHVHLDCQPLDGGGYETMLNRAVCELKRKEKSKGKFSSSFLLVDGDRGKRNEDGWSLSQLKEKASKQDMKVCIQDPNQEGWLLRMMPGNERLQPNRVNMQKQLRSVWPDYQKPIDSQTLHLRFKLDDLLRLARVDAELKMLLSVIGFPGLITKF
jgi:hypothetical protein